MTGVGGGGAYEGSWYMQFTIVSQDCVPKGLSQRTLFLLRSRQPKIYYDRKIQRTSYITVTLVIFTSSLPLSGGGDRGVLPYHPLSLSSRLLYPFSISLPFPIFLPLFFLPLPPPISLFSLYTHSFLPSLFFHHTLFLSLLLPTLSPPLESSPLPPLKHDEDDASGLTLPPSRVRHVICGMHNELAITITM